MKKHYVFIISVLLSYCSLAISAQNYTQGAFVLNEDWYGHNNSTLNFWNPTTGTIDYLIMQMANNYEFSLGCTSQYGQLYGDYIVITSKQERDPGEPADVQSGRITILNKKTLKPIGDEIHPLISVNENGKSDADGRGVCFVNNEKFYIGTSNGIYVFKWNEQGKTFTWDSEEIIAGTGNELITGDEISNADGLGPLYKNQIGMMLRAQDYVFAIKQDLGVIVIDPENDNVVKIIEGCFSTMAQSKDGNIWVGVNYQEEGYESNLKYPYGWNGNAWDGSQLMCINQYSLETRFVRLEVGGVPQSWYAWTAGTLTASNTDNALYFVYTDPSAGQINWFRNCNLYRYDIDKDECEEIYNSETDGLYFYGGAIQCNPKDGNIYAALYIGENIATQDWVYTIINNKGEMQQYQTPIKRYWYPAMFIFPDNDAPVIKNLSEVTISDDKPVEITLSDKVTDADSNNAAIIKNIKHVADPSLLNAEIVKGNLLLTPMGQGSTSVEIDFNSNGKITTQTLSVNITNEIVPDAIEKNNIKNINVIPINGNLLITGLESPQQIYIYNALGHLVKHSVINNGDIISELMRGMLYIIRISNQSFKIIL